jgi:hypothetical protein
MTLPKYPEMNRITLLYPSPQILLGEEIYWTEKRDGSQLRIAYDGEVRIATHHQDDASEQFKNYFMGTEQAPNVIEFLKDTNGFGNNPTADFNFGAVAFGELLVKGKSPARFEMHDRHEFVLFDIWSNKDQRFLSYNAMYQQAFHYNIPVVECWAMTQHRDLDSLFEYRDKIMEIAKEKKREGAVLKCYANQTFAKEKLDTPKIPLVHIEEGNPQLPFLPDSEVLGAIAKANADLGEAFRDKVKAMPLIAQYVAEEQKKHFCSKPKKSLFAYYTEYCEGLK